MHLSVRTYVFLLASAPAFSAQVRLTLVDAVSEALTSHPQLAAAAARAAAAEGLQRGAGWAARRTKTEAHFLKRFWDKARPEHSVASTALPITVERRHWLAAVAVLVIFFAPYQTLVQTVIPSAHARDLRIEGSWS